MKLYAFVIDDNHLAANSLVQMLDLLGYEAKAAYGSMAAFQALAKRIPDVILTDIHMQGLNGVEMCRAFRRDPRMERTAIIVMSTDTQSELVADLREAGAHGFLPKPIGMEALEQLMQQVEQFLSSRPAVT